DGKIPVWVPERCVRTVDAPQSGPDEDPCGESPIVDARKDQYSGLAAIVSINTAAI
ncbi:hypothetical protein STEG23_019515, partial [Scotinomys teguina]